MKGKIKLVYCDIGGVLFDEGGTKALKKDFNINLDKFREVRKKYLKKSLTGKITANELIDNVLVDINVNIKIANYNDYWASNSKPYPNGQAMLVSVSKYYPVGILTNNMKNSLSFYRKYDHLPQIDYKAIIESSKIGYKKPDEKIYRIAEKRSGFGGDSIFFIDDREVNLESAKKLGWHTFLYDKTKQEKSSQEILRLLEINL